MTKGRKEGSKQTHKPGVEECADNNNTPKAKGNGSQIQSQSVTARKIFFFILQRREKWRTIQKVSFRKLTNCGGYSTLRN